MNETQPLALLAALACGLLVGIERGWRQRTEADGTRVAGVRTFTLIGAIGGLAAVIANALSSAIAAIVTAGVTILLVGAFLHGPLKPRERDATTMVAALVVLLLGLLAGSGQPRLALAGSALVTMLLATREQSHRLLRALSRDEIRGFAYFAVIAAAVLPFLPNRDLGPYEAWNPFRLWLVVVLIIAFSVLGYIANRLFGENKGTIATALIGGAYSSTAVTASFSAQIHDDQPGPLGAGIALATAVMYLRVAVLAAILAPGVTLDLVKLLAPAAAMAWAASGIAWHIERKLRSADSSTRRGKAFRLLPALAFAIAVAIAAVFVRWAQREFGEVAGAWSLFLSGSFDVDTAIVALSTLSAGAIAPALAAVALAGTVAVNMAVKIAVVVANARWRKGRRAILALSASEVTLLVTLGWGLAMLT